MKNIDWSNMTLWALHGVLMLGAAYATSHADKWGWAVPPLMALASGAQAPSWGNSPAPADPAPKAFGSGGDAQAKVAGGSAGGLITR